MATFFSHPNEDRKKSLIKRFNIREVKAFGYSRDGLPLLDGQPAIIESYDQNGELVESYVCMEGMPEVRMTVSINETGLPIKIYCYDGEEFHTYDSRQKLIERKTFNTHGRIKEWVRYEYENPSAGVEVSREFSHKRNYHGKTVSRSNERGDAVFEAFFDAFDEPIGKNSYQYDEVNKLIRTVEWGVLTRRARPSTLARYLGLIYSENRFEYDGEGNLVKKLRFGLDETINWFQTEFYKFDISNRKIEEFGLDENGKVTWKMTFDYDLKDNLVSRVYNHAYGTKGHTNTFQYDDKGLETELIIEDSVENIKNKYLYFYEFYQ